MKYFLHYALQIKNNLQFAFLIIIFRKSSLYQKKLNIESITEFSSDEFSSIEFSSSR